MKTFMRVNVAHMIDGVAKSSTVGLIRPATIKQVEEVASEGQPVVKVLFDDGREIHCLGDAKHFEEGLNIAGVM